MGGTPLQALAASTRKRLHDAGITNADQEARWLICDFFNLTTADLIAHAERPMDVPPAFEAAVRRRMDGEPLQYILGTAPFFGRDFLVSPGVLIPRADTETLIAAALSFFPEDAEFSFMDWGTGSGCIGLTLLLERPQARALLADKSPEALRCAEANAERHGLKARARLLPTEDPADIPPAEHDLLISNPPYIPTDALPHLMREVRHEPRLALDGGADGMNLYRALLARAPSWLRPGGLVILEAGDASQAAALRDLPLPRLSFLRAFMDNSAIPRCVVWQYPG